MKRASFFKLVMLGMTIVLFPACDGILSGIYDDPPAKEFGFIEVDEVNNTGTIYIDATTYTRWTYINFHNLTIDTTNVTMNMPEPGSWDIAVHRYDTKTNGATALETEFTELSALKASGKMPEGTYIADEWTPDKIAIDMSNMMAGKIVYEESDYNTELSKWLFVDTSSMPPDYNPSNKVYVIKLEDNTVAAIRLRNFTSPTNVTGYLTIDYIYPLQF